MDWVASFLMCLLIVGVFFLGFFAGSMCGWLRGKRESSEYYSSYRDEKDQIINRLRGRIIWLEASIKDAVQMAYDLEARSTVLRERLERVENEP